MPHTPSVSSSETPSPPASAQSKSPQISPIPSAAYLHATLNAAAAAAAERQGNIAAAPSNPAGAVAFPPSVYPPTALPGK